MPIDSISSAAAYPLLTLVPSPTPAATQQKPPMCKSLYDPEPCCCPDWVIEELLDETNLDVDNEPELQAILSQDCVDCYTVDQWIEDEAAAAPTENEPSGVPQSVFDAIMEFIKSGDSDTDE